MRFFSSGPIIPDLLLNERDAGRVVFLCGAGVSTQSGMPSFLDLVQFVINKLDPEQDSEIGKAFAPWIDSKLKIPVSARTTLDQILNLLQLEYGRDQVGMIVSERLYLEPTVKARTSEHEIISRISADQNHTPQIVTTNFDHLFELALGPNNIRTYVPPTFPDLQHEAPVTGIIYLHGRISEPSDRVHDYILSSSDFGRAYLSQGWATSFVRELLQKYIVVLVGYQADDPPVKYLLQGLTIDQNHNKEHLYAFDQGNAEEIYAKWRDRGVTPIAYPVSSNHRALWDTLEAWANRSDNPSAWRSSIVNLAKKGPLALRDHERGMVAHLVRTAAGAKLFAEAKPTTPIEWLFVFDRTCRFDRPFLGTSEDANKFDPLEAYGLDDDPPRPPELGQEDPYYREDLISWRQGDDNLNHIQRLTGGMVHGFEPIPSRLFHLAKWILKHLDKPALAWWAARQHCLHPRLKEMLRIEIEGSDTLSEKSRKLWMILFEIIGSERVPDSMDMDWFHVLNLLKKCGWTSNVIRAFEAATEPTFKFSTLYGASASRPPTNDWSKAEWREIANIDLSFPSIHDQRPEAPDDVLPMIFAALQRNLVRASERLYEIEDKWFQLSTLYPEETSDKDHHTKEEDSYISWFVELLDRIAVLQPKLLRAHIDTWPDPERYIFDKLRLYAWNICNIFSGEEVSNFILGMQQDQFWNRNDRIEILFLLRDRWADFSTEKKELISKKILAGQAKYDEKEGGANNSIEPVTFFGWLTRAGCDMPKALYAKWLEMKNGLPEWRDSWIDAAVRTNEPKAGWVKTNEEFNILEGIPINQIVTVSKENTHHSFSDFTDYKPFLGLVKNAPKKAILALSFEARRGEYPIEFWNAIISNWPDISSDRATWLLHERMRRLPTEIIFKIRWAISHWMRDQFPKLVKVNEKFAYAVFDDLVGKILSYGPQATESGIGETRVGGKIVQLSRRTLNHATNAPIGQATEGLIDVLGSMELKQGIGLPNDFTTRVELFLSASGAGVDHAISILSHQMAWLNHSDPSWVSRTMTPWFNIEHSNSEPAWSGILYNDWVRIQPVFAHIKKGFLELPTAMRDWGWEDRMQERVYIWIVQASLLSSDGKHRLTFKEARKCLRQIDQNGLPHVILFLGRVGAGNDNGWGKMVIPFIQKAWPKERRFQTEKTSKAWVSILGNTGEMFPIVLNAVHDFLRPIRSQLSGLHKFHRKTGEKEPISVIFPKETLYLLDLIVSDDPRHTPYDLSQILNIILEADSSIEIDRRYERLRKLEASR